MKRIEFPYNINSTVHFVYHIIYSSSWLREYTRYNQTNRVKLDVIILRSIACKMIIIFVVHLHYEPIVQNRLKSAAKIYEWNLKWVKFVKDKGRGIFTNHQKKKERNKEKSKVKCLKLQFIANSKIMANNNW